MDDELFLSLSEALQATFGVFNIEKPEETCLGGFFDSYQEHCARAESWPITLGESQREREEQVLTAYLLANMKEAFLAGDTLSPIQAFLVAHKAGFLVPAWVSKHFADVFSEFVSAKGGKRLDDLFRIQRGAGQGNDPFSRQTRRHFNTELCEEICILNRVIGFILPVAYRLVSLTGFQGVTLSVDRLAEIYKDHGEFARSISIDVLKEIFNDNRERFLTLYLGLEEKQLQNIETAGLIKSYRKSCHTFLDSLLLE